MIEIVFILFFLSIPLFYIMGAIKFFSMLAHRKSPKATSSATIQRREYVDYAIKELQKSVIKDPDLTVAQQLQLYRQEIFQTPEATDSIQAVPHTSSSALSNLAPHAQPSSVLRLPLNIIWERWYSDNSINLILYLGAFLILASASIFIGVQWDEMPSMAKVLILGAATLLFLASGMTFLHYPKINQAGLAFTAIGALLIPLTGVAWISLTSVTHSLNATAWILVALLTLLSYLGLFLRLRLSFYLYLSSLASVLLALTFINLLHAPTEFYLLAGMIASLMLLVGFVLQLNYRPERKDVLVPMHVTAQAVMPIFVIFGLYTALDQSRFASLEAAICLLISTLFYGLCYAAFNRSWQFVTSLLLGVLTAISLLYALQLSDLSAYALLNLLGLFYLAIAWQFKVRRKIETSQIAVLVGIGLFIGTLLLSRLLISDSVAILIFIFMTVGASLIACFIIGNLRLAYLTMALLGYGTTYAIEHFGGARFTDQIHVASFTIYGMASYAVVHTKSHHRDVIEVFGLSSIFYGALGILLAANSSQYWLLTACLLLASVILAVAWRKLWISSLSTFSAIGIIAALIATLNALQSPEVVYPLVLSLGSAGLYGVFSITPGLNMQNLRAVPIVSSLLVSLFFFADNLFSINIDAQPLLDTTSLFSAYITSALIATEAYKSKSEKLGYAASAICIATLLWQLEQWGIHEVQVYTVVLSLYFLGLAWLQSRKMHTQNQQSLEAAGLLLLIAPTALQNLTSDSGLYFVLQLAYGLILTIYGISTKNKQYLYAGIASIVLGVIIKSYAAILLMPKWLLVGILGILFLSLGIYLLSRRRDEQA